MAIKVVCPQCGAKRSLSDAFRGLNVTCPKCSAKFTATGASSSGSSDSYPFVPDEAVIASASGVELAAQPSDLFAPESISTPPFFGGPAPEFIPPSSSSSTEAPISPDRPPPTAAAPGFVLEPTSHPPRPPAPGDASKPSSREYRVLTRKNLWFSGQFNAEAIEEALNNYAKQGWTLKSTMVVPAPGPDGVNHEVVIILER